MSFAGEILSGVEGTEYFYIVGIFLFIALFIVMIYRTMKMPKKDVIKFKTSILDHGDSEQNTDK